MSNTIPKNVVDEKPRDGKIAEFIGTWDTNGWVEAKNLIEKGVKNMYGDFPTTPQYNEYFRNNVSLDNHPEIKTWFDFLLHVEREKREVGQ